MEAQAPVNQTPPKNGPQMNQKKNLKVSNLTPLHLGYTFYDFDKLYTTENITINTITLVLTHVFCPDLP